MPDSEAKKNIMLAVGELLAEGCPVGDITVRKIAQRAGVGIGTVSYHFHSKDRLVYEVVAEQMADLAKALTEGDASETPLERLRRFFRKTAEYAFSYSDIFKAQLSFEILSGDLGICYYITPLLKEHFGSEKSDLEIKVLALALITAMQMILLKMEDFLHYTGVNIKDANQREEVLDILIATVMNKK